MHLKVCWHGEHLWINTHKICINVSCVCSQTHTHTYVYIFFDCRLPRFCRCCFSAFVSLSAVQSINYAIIEHFAGGGKNEAFFEFYSANFARYLANCCTLIEFRAANINFPRFSKRWLEAQQQQQRLKIENWYQFASIST